MHIDSYPKKYLNTIKSMVAYTIYQIVTVQPCPFISCRFVQSDNLFRQLPTTYFMLDVRPIKMNIQNALCEQAPNSILYIQFCMAELLHQIIYGSIITLFFSSIMLYYF